MLASVCHVLLQCGNVALTSAKPGEVLLFSKARNEMLRLPAFLEHYRKLGVDRFFVVDNMSDDGSFEYLLQQPDVYVFRTAGRFREARGGTDWLNALLQQFGVGHWCVTVDIDELLVFPGSDSVGLRPLIAHLEATRSAALCAPLLDMYPGGRMDDCRLEKGQSLQAAAPFFDPGPYYRFPAQDCPGVLVFGGVRERVFFPEARSQALRRKLHTALYFRVMPRVSDRIAQVGWIRERRPLLSPCLTKVPLVYWEQTTRYLNVNHFVSPRPLAAETGVLLHFKFLEDFHARAKIEAARGEYFDGAAEYGRYAQKLRTDPDLSFMYAQSTRYTGPEQLVELGLMTDTAAWRTARKAPSPA